MKNKMEIMTVDHPKWDEFLKILGSKKYCDVEYNMEDWNKQLCGITVDRDLEHLKCDKTKNRPKVRVVLKNIGNIDIEKSLQYFDEFGGHCDCKVILDVELAVNAKENADLEREKIKHV